MNGQDLLAQHQRSVVPTQEAYYIRVALPRRTKNMDACVWVEVDGEPVKHRELDGFDLFFHNQFDHDHYQRTGELQLLDDVWCVSCAITGARAGQGRSKQEAITDLYRKIDYPIDIAMAINKELNLGLISPRYYE